MASIAQRWVQFVDSGFRVVWRFGGSLTDLGADLVGSPKLNHEEKATFTPEAYHFKALLLQYMGIIYVARSSTLKM